MLSTKNIIKKLFLLQDIPWKIHEKCLYKHLGFNNHSKEIARDQLNDFIASLSGFKSVSSLKTLSIEIPYPNTSPSRSERNQDKSKFLTFGYTTYGKREQFKTSFKDLTTITISPRWFYFNSNAMKIKVSAQVSLVNMLSSEQSNLEKYLDNCLRPNSNFIRCTLQQWEDYSVKNNLPTLHVTNNHENTKRLLRQLLQTTEMSRIETNAKTSLIDHTTPPSSPSNKARKTISMISPSSNSVPECLKLHNLRTYCCKTIAKIPSQ